MQSALLKLFVAALLSVAIVVTALVAALAVAQRRRRSLQRMWAMRLVEAQEEEQARIAREVHDDALQRVALIRHELDALHTHGLAPDSPAARRVAAISRELEDLGIALRSVAHELHPSLIGIAGLAHALEALSADFARTDGLEVDLDLPDEPIRLPPDHALGIYRIAQEALRNVVRHSGVRRAALALVRHDGLLRMRVRDDGSGFVVGAPQASPGLGVVGMQERARLAHGTVSVASAPGAGTTVELVMPWPAT